MKIEPLNLILANIDKKLKAYDIYTTRHQARYNLSYDDRYIGFYSIEEQSISIIMITQEQTIFLHDPKLKTKVKHLLTLTDAYNTEVIARTRKLTADKS